MYKLNMSVSVWSSIVNSSDRHCQKKLNVEKKSGVKSGEKYFLIYIIVREKKEAR